MLISAAGGRVPRARLQPLPSLRSVQGLQLVLFPLESPPSAPINGVTYKTNEVMDMMTGNQINECEQLELLPIEQLVPQEQLVRKLGAAIDFSIIYSQHNRIYAWSPNG